MNKLEEARKKINSVDEEIAKLFEERMKAVLGKQYQIVLVVDIVDTWVGRTFNLLSFFIPHFGINFHSC